MRAASNIHSNWPITELLGSAGFTEHAASLTRRYWRRRRVLGVRELERAEAVKRAFGQIAKDWSDRDRILVGKFLSLLQAQAFDTGLRIGLTTQLFPEKT